MWSKASIELGVANLSIGEMIRNRSSLPEICIQRLRNLGEREGIMEIPIKDIAGLHKLDAKELKALAWLFFREKHQDKEEY